MRVAQTVPTINVVTIGAETHPGARPLVILVVEDQHNLRTILRQLLEDEGYQVASAADGRQALVEAKRLRPAVVVLDLGLPLLSGEDVAMELGNMFSPRPPIVVITARGNGEEASHRIGATAHVPKPFDLDHLLQVIRQALQTG